MYLSPTTFLSPCLKSAPSRLFVCLPPLSHSACSKSAVIVGPKKKLYVASYPVEQRDEMALRVEAMFDIPCGTVPNFLNLTLTPSNQILHPGESVSWSGQPEAETLRRRYCAPS